MSLEKTRVVSILFILRSWVCVRILDRAVGSRDHKTPAEAFGIKVEGENKWITLQNASSVKNCSMNHERREDG